MFTTVKWGLTSTLCAAGLLAFGAASASQFGNPTADPTADTQPHHPTSLVDTPMPDHPDLPHPDRSDVPRPDRSDLPRVRRPEVPRPDRSDLPRVRRPEVPQVERPDLPRVERPELGE
jgi:hypothetical protein